MVLDNLFDKANNYTEGLTVYCGTRLLEILAVCLWVLWGDPSVISSHCLCTRVWVASAVLLRGHKSCFCSRVAHCWHFCTSFFTFISNGLALWSRTWEANGDLGGEAPPPPAWNLMVHCPIHKSPSLFHIMNHLSPVRTFISSLFQIHPLYACVFQVSLYFSGDRGSTVVKVLCYKSWRSLVRSQLVSVDFSLT